MFPDDPMQPGPGESPLTLELGLIVFAIGVVVFVIIVGKLVLEHRRRSDGDEGDDGTYR